MPLMKYRTRLLLLILLIAAPQPIVARPSLAPSPPAVALQAPELPFLRDSPLTTPAAQLAFSITDAVPPEKALPLRARFEPALYKQLLLASDDEMVRGILWMREQADLSPMHALAADRLARRQAVVSHLRSVAERTQYDARALLEKAHQEGQVASYKPLWIVNAIAVQGTRQAFWQLAVHPAVQIILQDHVRQLPAPSHTPVGASGTGEAQWNVKRIQANRAWESLGITGEGVVVANLDSGVDWQHPDLMAAYRGYTGKPFPTHVGNWYCATDEGYTYPGDGQGHGTHTMGVMVGQNGIGVAPGARWIAAKVFSNQGFGLDSWIHDGFQWVLAPEGDPALAPDVVNCSWGNRTGTIETFLPDVSALRAAGVLPIFSAGNDGPDEKTIWAPASLRPSLAVGATDEDDRIALFSSRGPSPWGEIKPEISAPGVHIVSALPGGARGSRDGTSMAAPHVAGVVALMRQANPALESDETETILIDTAHALGDGHPNNQYGWGLVNAYAAVTWAGSFGQLSGRVTDAMNGAAIARVTIQAISHGGQFTATTTTDASGRYSIGLGAGRYDVILAGFGYQVYAAYGIEVNAGRTTQRNVPLTPLPTGTLRGTVTQTETGVPLGATVYVPGAPLTATTRPSDGSFALVLPRGVHTVRAESAAHRFMTATVVISPGATTTRNYALDPAPSVLLVDSGAWYNDSRRAFYQKVLEEQRYLYDLDVIANIHISPTDVPEASDLRPYDLVLWSAPQDAPGYIGASDAIAGYLDGGGRLFLSGQDVAFWDGGGSQSSFAYYFRDHLKARYVADDAPSRVLDGQSAPFAGLTITIGGGDGADNQVYPDVIAVDAVSIAAGDLARSAWGYHGDGSGGQIVGPCLPYRAVYLAFGLEGVNNGTDRREILRRSIAWLTGPPQPAGIEINGEGAPQVGRAGEQVTHAVRVRNLSELSVDAVGLNIQGHTWPTALWDRAPVLLGACQTTTVHIAVDIPPNIGWHVSDTVTLSAHSSLSPAIQTRTVLTAKTPAPVLLVDGARFFPVKEPYQLALRQAGIAYDRHQVHGERSPTIPTSDTLAMYPTIVWYTGYNWYDPLSEDAERALLAYLRQGGRLFLSSQDYLYYGHERPLAREYLGVLEFSEGISATVAAGQIRHRIGWGLGPYPLTYPYQNWSDALIPAPGAEVAFRGQHARPIAVTYAQSTTAQSVSTSRRWRTAFLAFPFETLHEDAAPEVMQRAVGWLSWLGSSTWGTDRRTVNSGSLVTMTCVMRNDGQADVSFARFSTTLPSGVSLVPDSLSSWADFSPATRQIEWEGTLDNDEQIEIEFCVRVSDSLPDAASIGFPARIGYDEHALSFEAPYILRLNAPDLGSSALAVEPATASPSSTLTYTLTVRNTGVRDALATVTATAPSQTWFTGTLDTQDIGAGEILSQSLAWNGPVKAGDTVSLRYQLALGGADGYWLTHQAHVRDQHDEHWPVETQAYIRFQKAYLPVAYHQAAR
jgi:uncharacterized repeat protein (TIGR01451 family)